MPNKHSPHHLVAIDERVHKRGKHVDRNHGKQHPNHALMDLAERTAQRGALGYQLRERK